ncbi:MULTISPECIES: pilus assembly protein N-terminal domain-containing protein [unclassified Bradyrhizobium]|uniref:pilus assembly protein N-terminal domain-containing protein n=1 Tax=unclassified Bradyrhizobium TaxID=2631580 RepID=UPI001FF995FD|nr:MULTISPECIES: pilus assembly protein N-terminal domain-containing protein [unclassified Bradyrhizobium]MCK1294974.1 pilus assembly protein N-terminal domain-containing protein [Bradyrhizobium sp. 30]MCK1309396.1 pilus assembly protein N-terminal domain-containing protein [Bradyrhizobium sp. 45]MCK1315005.1 pilus assembly protein N-terminal domain-containing protein [Bradyrhizobium sp. 23]MCK1506896.1 pilus assembly protein N-terminal domain-containing protein [Bradyrhizobium sp. 18]MCK16149
MAAILRACALGLNLLIAAIPAARAGDQTVTLNLGSGSTLLLERPFKTVLIGDPNVVDLRTLNSRSVVLTPRDTGATNLIFVDENSVAIANVKVIVREPGTI